MLKSFFYTFLFICFSVFFANPVMGQKIFIEQQNGSTHNEQLSSVQNLHFQSDNLILKLVDGANLTYGISEIKKIYFDESIGVNEKHANDLKTFPNPVKEKLKITGIELSNNLLQIYRADGLLVLTVTINSDADMYIDVTQLKPGLYIIRSGSFTSKFIKQ